MAKIIQWYPGHMAKAFRQMKENLSLVDIVFELVDARIPFSSRNPRVDELVGDKPRILIFSKADLADPAETSKWKKYYEEQGLHVLILDTRNHKTPQLVSKMANHVLAAKKHDYEQKGIINKTIRALIIGVPNVGKSTLLNHLIEKNVAITGDKPGVTKKVTWLKTKNNMELLDSPGVLWPKFEDQTIGIKLALTGAVKDNIYARDDAVLYLLDFYKEYNPTAILERYHLTEADFELSTVDLLLKITAKLGFKDDYDKAAERILIDLRKGRLGNFTLDKINELEDIEDGGND